MKKSGMLNKCLAAAVLCSLAGGVFTTTSVEAAEMPIFALDTIMVEAQRDKLPGDFVSREGNLGRLGNKDVMDVPFNVTNFTEKTIDTYRDPSAQLTGVLENSPSVRSYSYTLYNDFSIRGLGMSGYNLYVNGVPGMFTQSTIPTNFVERVEVISGPAMGFNGTSIRPSAAGLVNMYSKRAGDEDLTRYKQSFSGESSFGEHIDISRRFGEDKQWGVRINAENVSGKELHDVGEKLTNRDFFINVDHHNDNSKTNILGGYSYSKLDKSMRWLQFTDAVTVLPDAPKSTMNYAYDGQGASLDRWMGIINHEQKINDDVTAFGNFAYSRYDLYRNITGRACEPYTVFNNKGDFNSVDRDGTMAVTNYYSEIGLKGEAYTGDVKHNLVLSFDKSWSTMWGGGSGNKPIAYAGNIYEGRLTNFHPDLGTLKWGKSRKNVFWGWGLVDTMEYGKAQLMAGFQNQHSTERAFRNNKESSRLESSDTSPVYGIIYKPEENISLYASHTESFAGGKAVTDSKYTGNSGVVLSPAKTKQNEVGIKYEADNILTSLSFFDIKKAGYVDEMIDKKLYLMKDGEDEYKGVEFSASGKVASKWNAMGGVMYLDATRNKTTDKNKDGVGDYDGYRVNGTSHWNGVMSLEYEADEDFSVIARALYNGSCTIKNGKLHVPAFMTYDLGVSYKTEMGETPVKFNVMCYNLFNKDHWVPKSGKDILVLSNPRTFAVSAEFDF